MQISHCFESITINWIRPHRPILSTTCHLFKIGIGQKLLFDIFTCFFYIPMFTVLSVIQDLPTFPQYNMMWIIVSTLTPASGSVFIICQLLLLYCSSWFEWSVCCPSQTSFLVFFRKIQCKLKSRFGCVIKTTFGLTVMQWTFYWRI